MSERKDNMKFFTELREKFGEFVYKSYTIEENDEEFKITYHFEITGLSEFNPSWRIKKGPSWVNADREKTENLVFSLGMVELISYWKITCAPRVVIMPQTIDSEQINWWKEQYFLGLGEFFYINSIGTTQDDFMEIVCRNDKHVKISPQSEDYQVKGDKPNVLIPIGGGKDSIVTLELLKDKADCRCYIINPRGATVNTVKQSGLPEDRIIAAYRTLDKNMLELNKQGYLNGHTPFSAIVAFSATLFAYLNGIEYIALSNESSANESTVPGLNVNHQYSKSFEFEQAFQKYNRSYLASGTHYFSFLRPLTELQIAALFSKNKDYYKIFRSCNLGSAKDIWCANCPKCLFVYIILSPFIPHDELTEIFGKDMLNDSNMIETFEKLTGMLAEKPFECVGSRDEVNAAISYVISKYREKGEKLPLLLEHYTEKKLVPKFDLDYYNNYYDGAHSIPEYFENILKGAIRNCLPN